MARALLCRSSIEGNDANDEGGVDVLETGKRLVVFSVKETQDKEGRSTTVWVKAGSAWVNRDGSLNVYLDVLPLEGKLHVREALEKRDGVEGRGRANGSSAREAMEAGQNA